MGKGEQIFEEGNQWGESCVLLVRSESVVSNVELFTILNSFLYEDGVLLIKDRCLRGISRVLAKVLKWWGGEMVL